MVFKSVFFSSVTKSRKWSFSVVQGVYTFIRKVDCVRSNSSQIFFEDVLWARHSALCSRGYTSEQDRKHGQGREIRMCTGACNTKQWATCFERRTKQGLLSLRGKNMYSWPYQIRIYERRNINLETDLLGFIQLEVKVKAVWSMLNVILKDHLLNTYSA